MDGYELIQQLNQKSAMMDKALEATKDRAISSAKAETTYRTALAKAMLTEREKGTPVTIISDICRGQEEIAALRQERDIAEALYKAAREAINVYKIQTNILREQVEREWSRG